MTDYVISCDTVARLAKVLQVMPDNASEWFRSIRIDNGCAVVSNRATMVVELIGGPSGIVHLRTDPELVEQCIKEAPYGGKVTVTVNEALKFAVAKTTFGYAHPGNCAVWSDVSNELDRWRSIAWQTKEPLEKSVGAMFWNVDQISTLGDASPSGRIVFEAHIDAQRRPTVIRDITDYNWFALFNPFNASESYSPATLPTWLTEQ